MARDRLQRTGTRGGMAAGVVALLVLGLIPTAAGADVPDRIAAQATALQQWRGTGQLTGPTQTPQAQTPSAQRPPAVTTATEGTSPVVPGSLLVTMTGTYDSRAFSDAGFTHVSAIADGIVRVDVDPSQTAEAMAELQAQPGVQTVEMNRVRQFHAVPDDTRYAEQWAHQLTGIEDAWDATTGSVDVQVAVADSGVVASHPDLAGVVVEQVDASTGEIRPGATDNDLCRVGHGTWVAGILAGVGNNAQGVSGVNWNLSILDINTADPIVSCVGPTDAGTIAAIDYAVRQGADVVNLSLGGPDTRCPTAMQQAITSAVDAGTVVVASSGNGGDATPNVPGSCNGTISVGSVGPDGSLSSFSTTNPYVDLVAPGGGNADPSSSATEILTTSFYAGGTPTEEYVAVTGTSFSAPYVSGMAALMRATNPGLSVPDIESLLESSASDLGPEGRDDGYGFGLVQGVSVLRAATGEPVDPPAEDPDFPVGESSAARPGGPVSVQRISGGTGRTEPVGQAVAVSRAVFGDARNDSGNDTPDNVIEAQWGVLARADDYADALAGSPLTLGVAPLLFTGHTGPLAPGTAAELSRVLGPGSDVFILGGVDALPASLEEEITALGLNPVRLAGPIRESTAIEIADQTDRQLTVLDLPPSPAVIVVTRENWPDATGAGQLGAQFGFPILLTSTDRLATVTADAIADRDLQRVYVVGGNAAVSAAAMDAVAAEAGSAESIRLAGPERNATLIAVSREVESIFESTPVQRPRNLFAANVRRDDGFAHLLSATVPLGTFTGVFVPIEGEEGGVIADVAADYVTGMGLDISVMGDTDLIADTTVAQLQTLVESTP